LTEAENRYGEAFGEGRLLDLAQSIVDLSCADIVKRIHGEIRRFSHGKLVDDFTLIALKAE
jgi:serine phosphatase RsbU (regulator of sigma subunit)